MPKVKEPFISPVKAESASKDVQEIYASVQKKLNGLPNMFLNMGNSASVLKGYLNLSEAVNHSSLNSKLRESIQLVVSEANQCDYCLAAHSAIGKAQGLTNDEIINARKGDAKDMKTKAILHFAKEVAAKRARISEQDIAALKEAGVSNKEFADIIMAVILAIFTNYFNILSETPVDFPQVPKI